MVQETLKARRFPTSKEEADEQDEMFMREFEQLSMDKHEKILFDVHGFAAPDEDPKTVERSLEELTGELDSIKEKYAFERAKYFNQAYVTDRRFHLMFLRCLRFDVKLAAELLVRHFESKLKLFGDTEILARDIRMSDLSEEALAVLEHGAMQILPSRDLGGRAVECCSTDYENSPPKTVACAIWYYYMVALQDEQNQTNGFVEVFYNYDKYNLGEEHTEEMHHAVLGLPIKLCGVHYCTHSDNAVPFVAGVRNFLEGDERYRMRSHIGTPEEVEFKLQTFGIPTSDSPMQRDGTWSTRYHKEWLKRQRELEEQEQSNVDTIITPGRYDVLFGRSKICRQHTGNLRLIYLCQTHLEEYEGADKAEKTKIAEALLGNVRESEGRFLKSDNGGWVKVTDSVAREKISHFFRHLRSKASPLPSTADQSTTETRKRTLASTGVTDKV